MRRAALLLTVLAVAAGGCQADATGLLRASRRPWPPHWPRHALSPEAACALAALPPYLEALAGLRRHHGGGRHPAPRLHIAGTAKWLDDDFLRRLPGVLPLTVTDRLTDPDFRTAVNFLLVVTKCFEEFEGVFRSLPSLPLSLRTRILVWTSSPSLPNVSMSGGLVTIEASSQHCREALRTAITTGDGTTHFFGKFTSCVDARWNSTELDRWTPRAGWRSGADIFPEPCLFWRPSPDGALTAVFNVQLATTRKMWISRRVLEALKQHGGSQPFSEQTLDNDKTVALSFQCRLDLQVSAHVALSNEAHSATVFPWQFHQVAVVVPAGLGRGRNLMYRLSDAFSPTLWHATMAAAMATSLALWLFARRSSAWLQTLAPLLAQPPPREPFPRERPLSGAWLLASVVLSAAYQGQLLSRLTVPDPLAEIDSLDEVAQSGLTLLIRPDLVTLDWGGRVETVTADKSVDGLVKRVAEYRDVAALVDAAELSAWRALTRDGPGKRLHFFVLPELAFLQEECFMSRGSPLEAPLRKVLGRLRAAGLTQRWVSLASRQGIVYDRDGCTELLNVEGPETLRVVHFLPAFICLGFGLACSLIVFALEQVVGRPYE